MQSEHTIPLDQWGLSYVSAASLLPAILQAVPKDSLPHPDESDQHSSGDTYGFLSAISVFQDWKFFLRFP